MADETAAQNPNEAASTDASATLLAAASTETDKQTQPAETQPAAEPAAKDATTTDGTSPAPKTGAPEKYEFKAPEGKEFDARVLEAFGTAAKEADLSQEAAQKLIETMAPALAARQADQVQAIHQEWLNASTADKEFGGDKLTQNLGVARKALDTFGTPDLRKLLDVTGMGNHPEVIRFMYRAGKAISEDTFVGGKPSETGRNPTSILYDKTTAAS